jgi:penicillin-insensitive murein endopeptidase
VYPFVLVALQACFAAPPARSLSEVASPPAEAADSLVAEEPAITPAAVDSDIVSDSEPEPGPEELPPPAELAPHPLAELSNDELEEMLLENPDALGPLSLGRPAAGALFGAEQMESSERWEVVNPRETWGTRETIEYLARCIDSVNEQFPDTPKIPIGDISARSGGHLVPHISHQSGRDVDVAYYYRNNEKWYTRATADNLDFPRTWAFVKAMVTETDVDLIFIDRSIQKLLRDYATSIGEDEGWLDEVFGGPTTPLRSIIRHEKGHKSHIHVRFYNPTAQESGRRVYRMLIKHKKIKPPTYYIKHKVRRGDTLNRLARKYKTSVRAIKKANRLRSHRIYAGRKYKIPRRGGVARQAGAVVIPTRRLPPPKTESVANKSHAHDADTLSSSAPTHE